MRKKIVSSILISIIIISKIFVIVNAANIKETNITQNANDAKKVNAVQETNTTTQNTNKASNKVNNNANSEAVKESLDTTDKSVKGSTSQEAEGNTSPKEEVKKEEYISEDDLIYSNKYLVKGKEITRIEPKTSIKEFKKNIETAKGKEIKIYKGQEEITSGYIGTGMTVKGTNEEEYTLSVIGDISRRRTSKPNRTNNDNPSYNKPKRLGTKRNKKRISRHKRRRKNKPNRYNKTNKLHSIWKMGTPRNKCAKRTRNKSNK